jgi:hypothetical protein
MHFIFISSSNVANSLIAVNAVTAVIVLHRGHFVGLGSYRGGGGAPSKYLGEFESVNGGSLKK